MAVNLLNLLKDQFSGPAVANLAATLGESPSSTQRAVEGALPAVLGRLVSAASTEQGVTDLFRMIHGARLGPPGLASPADTLRSASATKEMLKTRGPLVSGLFGGQQGGVIDWLASFSGISRPSAASLLGLVVPLVVNFVSTQATFGGAGFTPSALAGVLAGQRGFFQGLPGGLAAVAGLPNLGGYSATAGDMASAASGGATGGLGWLKWALPILAVAAIVFGVRSWRGPVVKADATAAAATGAPAAAGPAVAAPSATITSAYGVDLGGLVGRRLPNGIELTIPEKGVEAQLLGFVEDASMAVSPDRWLTLDRIEFETGSATLRPSAQDQVRNLSEILKAYPNLAVKLGGYTDNTGSASANMALSTDRAVNTMKAVLARGAAADRVTAEGYGPQHPVASNDTAEGRQRNRRIDLRVTRK